MSYQVHQAAAVRSGTARIDAIIAALIGAAAAALIAASPLAALAHPLGGGAAASELTGAAQEQSGGASPLDAGINMAVSRVCTFSVSEGDALLDTQADLVGGQVAGTAEAAAAQAAAEAEAEADAAASEHAAAPAQPAFATIDIDGDAMPYVSAYLATTAPSSGAGLWMGSDSTTDGSWGYFIGHNPGPFHHVMDLAPGDAITVTDSAGAARTYRVVDVFTVPDTTAWEDIQQRVTGYGESIILQTCCGDDANYRIVVAA